MNANWERDTAISRMGHFLSILDRLGLAEWELGWLTSKDWSIYASTKRF